MESTHNNMDIKEHLISLQNKQKRLSNKRNKHDIELMMWTRVNGIIDIITQSN